MFVGVTQRVEGWPYGECVRATYATILGMDIEDVPRFDPAVLRPGEEQSQRERRWLASIGLDLFEISTNPEGELPEEVLGMLPQAPNLMSGISPRGFGHRVMGYGGQVAWDPHPSRAGLVTIYSVGYLIPMGAMK